MYYKTILQKVGTTGAIDSDGKKLSFMSYIEVQAGDTVWTDGKFIFGHALEVEDTPFVPIMNSGIPVLGDNLCGYFTLNGQYKKYKFYQDDWIVNEKHFFKHGNEDLIDTEIADNGDIYTAERNLNGYQAEDGEILVYFSSAAKDKAYQEILIKKNGIEQEKISVYNYMTAVEKINEIYDKELNKENGDEGLKIVWCGQLLNFKLDNEGNWEMVMSSSAYGVLKHNIPYYRDIKINLDVPSYKSPVKGSNRYVHFQRKNNYFSTVEPLDSTTSDGIIEELYQKYGFTGDGFVAAVNQFVLSAYQRPTAIELKTIGGRGELVSIDPPEEDTFLHRKVTAYYLVKFKSNGNKEIINEEVKLQSATGVELVTGIDVFEGSVTTGYVDETTFLEAITLGERTTLQFQRQHDINFPIGDPIIVDDSLRPGYIKFTITKPNYKGYYIKNYKTDFTFPIQDGFYAKMSEWKMLGIYDEDGKKICDSFPDTFDVDRTSISIPYIEDDVSEDEEGSYINVDQLYDYEKQKVRDYLGNERIEGTIFVTEGYFRSRYSFRRQVLAYFLEGHTTPELTYNLSIAKLRNGYLVGFFGNFLYKVDEEGNFEKLGEGLKNFRLRELKNMAKAKK